ncbi:DMT family transporter [Kribbella sp. NPDC056345]|uniref:DMT family transporter n=1 Tax=Kribbella sp. NPDC056345 TaxID=3345789 RepID=UPI0035D5D928
MTNRSTAGASLLLVTVAALWGASFLFIRIAVPALGPVVLMEARVLIAGLILLAVVAGLGRLPNWRTDWKGYVVLGTLSAAVPFTLIAVAELWLTASLAAILNATTPLFTLLIGAARRQEELSTYRLAGVLLGLLGVCVVVGLGPLQVDLELAFGVVASLAAAVLYAVGGLYAKARFPSTPPTTVATGQQLGAALVLLLPSFALPPRGLPSPGIAVAVLALSVGCTAVGFALFYRILALVGPTGALSVTFLVPVFGLLWGSVFLDEHFTVSTIIGLLVILSGVALVTRRPLVPHDYGRGCLAAARRRRARTR